MGTRSESVTVQIELPREEYERLEGAARAADQSVSAMARSLTLDGLMRQMTPRELLERASALYWALMAREGKTDQTPEQVLQELRELRERIANEFYP